MEALLWQDKSLSLLNQSKFPQETIWHDCNDYRSTVTMLQSPAVTDESVIAVAASYAYCLAAIEFENSPEFYKEMTTAKESILSVCQGCVAALEAIKQLEKTQEAYRNSPDLVTAILASGVMIHRHDVLSARTMSQHGREIIPDEANIILSCRSSVFHTGSLGGVLGIIRAAHRKNQIAMVNVCENRPNLEGSMLVSHELASLGVNTTVIADHTAATLIPRRSYNIVLIEGIRLAANGDLLAGPGTYQLAISAYFHSTPVYASVNTKNVDSNIPTGDAFPQNDGDATALSQIAGKQFLPESVSVWTPEYEVIPHYLLTGLITEKGLAFAPFDETIPEIISKKSNNNVVTF